MMFTDDELLEIGRLATREAMRVAHEREGFSSNMSRESIVASLRAVEMAARQDALGRDTP